MTDLRIHQEPEETRDHKVVHQDAFLVQKRTHLFLFLSSEEFQQCRVLLYRRQRSLRHTSFCLWNALYQRIEWQIRCPWESLLSFMTRIVTADVVAQWLVSWTWELQSSSPGRCTHVVFLGKTFDSLSTQVYKWAPSKLLGGQPDKMMDQSHHTTKTGDQRRWWAFWLAQLRLGKTLSLPYSDSSVQNSKLLFK